MTADVDGVSAEPDPSGPLARIGPVALALWLQGATRTLAQEFSDENIPAMLLKGPDLQQRLYGSPATYTSGDVDILIRPRDRRRAFAFLSAQGWEFESNNGYLWRWSRAASFRRETVCLDLHWGLHAAHLPAMALDRIEHELWSGARIGPTGLYEPPIEALTVYLAVHAAGHGYERTEWLENARRAAGLVDDAREVDRIAREARVSTLLGEVIDGDEPPAGPILDGLRGKVVWWLTWLLRGHFLSPETRERIKGLLWLASQGDLTAHSRTVMFAGLEIRVSPGVFEPRGVSEEILQLSLDKLPEGKACLVDVGTGSGAIALAAAAARPDAIVVGIDTSSAAIRCAKANARRLRIRNARFVRGELLNPLPAAANGRVDVIAANLPYVPATYARGTDWEAPITTVEGPGIDGLGLLRVLGREGRMWLRTGGWFVMQMIDWQWEPWSTELSLLGYDSLQPPAQRRPSRAVVGAGSKGVEVDD